MRESNYSLLLHAGPEIAVASTKAYVAQLTTLAILAETLSDDDYKFEYELGKVATAIDNVFAKKHEIEKIAIRETDGVRNCFYIGRTVDSLLALEAALKLKEISYIQTEGFASGELKHGTIALIEDGVPVFGIITQSAIAMNTRSNLEEVKARGAKVATIVTENIAQDGDDIIIDQVNELLAPIVAAVPCQLISYYASLHRGLDIDKPRNLAKSVTVE
jgi:glucosamine--fructose-6-phosphate aminotransferase (isomerizing)